MECPRCQAKVAVSPYRTQGETKHVSMQSTPHEAKIHYASCASCGGVFVEKADLVKVETRARERARTIDRSAGVFGRAFKVAKDRFTHVSPSCPRCKEEMFEREWRSGTMVMIDICVTCEGVWLDAGELEALEEFFSGGA